MPQVLIKVGFYQPFVVSQPPKTLLQLIEEIHALPDDETRTFSKKNFHPVRIQNLQRWNGFWWGEAMRIKMNEEMHRAKLNGEVREIEFAADEGLGESSAFLYHPGTNMLVLQEVHGAVSRTTFALYLKHIGHASKVDLRPAINPDAIERIDRLQITEFRINMARIHNVRDRGADRLTGGFFRSLDAMNAGRASIVVKPAAEGTLARVSQFVTELMSDRDIDGLTLNDISVKGSENEEVKVIDLLEDRLVATEEIFVEDGRRPNAAQRRDALRNAWNRLEGFIHENYTPA